MDRTGLHLELWGLRRMEECVGGSQNGESGWENNEIALWVHACLQDLHTDWCKSEWPQGPWGGGETKASVSLLTTGLGADIYLLVKMTTRYCRNMFFLFSFDLYSLTTKQEHDVISDLIKCSSSIMSYIEWSQNSMCFLSWVKSIFRMDPESCLGMKKLWKIQKNGPDDFIERKSQA